MKEPIFLAACLIASLYMFCAILIRGAEVLQFDLSEYSWVWEVYMMLETMIFWCLLLPGILFSSILFGRLMYVCYSGVFLAAETTWEELSKLFRVKRKFSRELPEDPLNV